MVLILAMVENYITVIEEYIRNRPIRFWSEAKLCEEKHASAANFLLSLKTFVEKYCDIDFVPSVKSPSEAGSESGMESDGVDSLVVRSKSASPIVCRKSSFSSVKSADAYMEQKPRSLIYYSLLTKKSSVAPSPSIYSSISRDRRKYNTNECRLLDDAEIISDELENMFKVEKQKIAMIRAKYNHHKEGSYDALLYVIIENINVVKERYKRMKVNLQAYSDQETMKRTPQRCDSHKRNLLLFLAKFICAIAYDREIFLHEALSDAQKGLYNLRSGFSGSKNIVRDIEDNLCILAAHIFDHGFQSIHSYVKIFAEFSTVKSHLSKLQGISPSYLGFINDALIQLEEQFRLEFPQSSLRELLVAYEKRESEGFGEFSLDSAPITRDDSPFAQPKYAAPLITRC